MTVFYLPKQLQLKITAFNQAFVQCFFDQRLVQIKGKSLLISAPDGKCCFQESGMSILLLKPVAGSKGMPPEASSPDRYIVFPWEDTTVNIVQELRFFQVATYPCPERAGVNLWLREPRKRTRSERQCCRCPAWDSLNHLTSNG